MSSWRTIFSRFLLAVVLSIILTPMFSGVSYANIGDVCSDGFRVPGAALDTTCDNHGGLGVTFEYVDHNRLIASDGKIYSDNKIDSELRYEQYQNDVCTGTKNPSNPYVKVDARSPSKGTFFNFVRNDAAKDCKAQPGIPIDIAFVGKGSIFFNWVNSGLIKNSDLSHTYTLYSGTQLQPKSPSAKLYTEPGKCTTTLEADTANPDQGLLTVRTSHSNTLVIFDAGGSYFGYQFSSQGLNDAKSNKARDIGGKCDEFPAYAVAIGSTDLATGTSDPSKDPNAKNSANGDCSAGEFSWVICPIVKPLIFIINKLASVALRLLEVSPLGGGVKDIVGSLTKLADVMFVLVFLVVIASTTLSIGLTNYSIKKLLPKFIIAVVLVQFSFPIMQILVDISNVVGRGIGGLIDAAVTASCNAGPGCAPVLSGPNNLLPVALMGIFGAGAVAGAIVLAPGILVAALIALFGLFLSLLTMFLTLFLRALMIQILAIAAPIAFVLWVLPNTEKYFTIWWKSFTRLLLMYPIIAALLASGKAVSTLANKLGATSTPTWLHGLTGSPSQIRLASIMPPNLIHQLHPQLAAAGSPGATVVTTAGDQIAGIMAAIAPIITFFLIPKTFKWAGAAMNFAAEKTVGKVGKAASKKYDEKTGAFKKNLTANRQEKGAAMALSPDSKFLKRGFGRLRAGAIMPGSASQRKLRSLAARGDKALQDEAIRAVRDLSHTQLAEKAMDARSSEAQRIAAISRLASESGHDQLRDVRQSLGGDAMGEGAEKRLWDAGIKNSFGDLSKSSPDITGGSKAFDDVSPEQLAGFNKKTAEKYVAHLKKRAASGDPGAKQAVNRAAKALAGVGSSAALSGKVTGDVGNVLHEGIGGIFSGPLGTDLKSLIDPGTGRFNGPPDKNAGSSGSSTGVPIIAPPRGTPVTGTGGAPASSWSPPSSSAPPDGPSLILPGDPDFRN